MKGRNRGREGFGKDWGCKMIGEKINLLRQYFSNEPEILFTFLFGSRAKEIQGKISDWDIAVYFRPKGFSIEWEEVEQDYPEEDRIWNDLIDILKTDEVDLVVLNRAPANVASQAISQGIPIIVKDRGVFIDFMLIIMRQAEDYQKFVDEYYEISQKSSSLSSKEKERLKKIISFLEEEMTLYDYFSRFSFKDYNDIHKRHEVERWVENMVNSSIDIGEIILASERKKIPDYYRDIFIQLNLLEEFSDMNVKKFTNWIKLRNILAHEYLDIKWKRIKDFIEDSKKHFILFLKNVKRFL